jgi:SnoaL-like domain
MTTTNRAFADRYVECVNSGAYDKLGLLFAEDAQFHAPGNRELNGRTEIDAFYQQFLPTLVPIIRIASFVEQGRICVYELEARIHDQPQFTLAAIDHATLDGDGKVIRFAVFTK